MAGDQLLGGGEHAWGIGRAVARPVEQRVGQRCGIACTQGQDEGQELLLPPGADMADQAEVEQRQPIARQAEQVAGVRIAMKAAVDQHHVEHQRRAEVGNGGGIDPGGAQAVPVARRQAGDIVHHQHGFAAVAPVDGRNDDRRIVGKVGAQAIGIAAFIGEVQLLQHRVQQLPDQRLGLEAAGFLAAGLHDAGEMGDEPQVGLHRLANAGSAYLHDDVGAVLQSGAMHLRHRGRGERDRIEAGKGGFGGLAQRVLQPRAQRFERQGGGAAVQGRKFGHPMFGQQVRAGGEDLPELHIGGAQRFERLSRAAGQIGWGRVAGSAGQAHAREQHVETEARGDGGDFGQPLPVAGGNDDRFQHDASTIGVGQCFGWRTGRGQSTQSRPMSR